MGKSELSYTAGGDVKWYRVATLENNLAVSQKVNQRVTILAIPLLGIYSREMKTSHSHKHFYIKVFHSSIIFNRQKVEIIQMFIN